VFLENGDGLTLIFTWERGDLGFSVHKNMNLSNTDMCN
jgi:hypothetical protein